MTRQQRVRMRKELRVKAVSLIERMHRKRICFECGARVRIQKDTGNPITFRFVKHAPPCNPWIEINRIEIPHKCSVERICAFSMEHKRKMLLI